MKSNNLTYSYDEVYKSTLEYFNGDDLATNVWISKYCRTELTNDGEIVYHEKTPDDMFHRIAREISRAGMKYNNPLTENEVYELIKDYKYILFAGRPMAGIGVDDAVSISNCFVVGKPGMDSYGTIATVDQEIMQLSKRGGGVGTDLSDYRPNGAKVHNAAKTSSGPVEICATRFSNTIREVGQNGRRGALMLSMDINHPSAEEFMDAKMEDGKITGANISIKLYDDWMKSALGIDCEMDKEKNRLWKKIVHNATTKAEPGILFWDNIINDSVADCYKEFGYKTTSTNPCFPSSEYLLTDKGYVKFGDLYKNGENNVVMTDNRISYIETQETETPEQWHINEHNSGVTPRNASNVFLTKNNTDVSELVFANGSKLRCTPDHHIATINRGMVEAKDLTVDDKVLVGLGNISESIKGKMPETTEEILALLCGLVMGDGVMSINKKQERCSLSFWGEDSLRMSNICTNLIDKLVEQCGTIKGSNHKTLSKYFISTKERNGVSMVTITSSYLGQLLRKYFNYTKASKHVVPEYVMNNASTNIGKFFIAGLMYCDGSISGSLNKGISVRLHQSNLELLRQMQMLFNANGFFSTIKLRRKEQMRKMPDGKGGYKEYFTKANYDLIITAIQSEDYINNIGFIGDIKKECKFTEFAKNKRTIKSYTNLVSYTLCNEKEDVYCIKEPVTRSIIVNNISTRRCGELPLCPEDSCRLMALNLYSYVVNPFSDEAYFDIEKFIDHCKKTMKIMDNMIELELEKIDSILAKVESDPESDDIKMIEKNLWTRIRKKCKEGRRSGIGITAMGDMLAALNLKYGTEVATEFTAYIQKILATSVYVGSCDLVQVDGRPAFGCFDYNLEKENPFLNRLTTPFTGLLSNNPYVEYANSLAYEFEKKWRNNLGRRNIACLTIAPTGSLSTQTQTTSGIEPVFMISYRRRRKIDKNSGIKPDFIDKTGDYFIEFNVVHNKFIVWYSVYKNITFNEAKLTLEKMSDTEINDVIKLSPYFNATAMDCDWHERVNMQGKIQKYVDHSISVTVNLPKGTSEETVEDVYRTAWESGCKGSTIYVDGCRDGVLINKEEKKKCECSEFIDTTTPKRPKKLPCKIIKFSNKGVKWIAAVGLYEGRPYEIFTGLAEKLNIPNGIENGFIIRNKVPKEVLNEDNGMIETIKVSRYDIEYTQNGETKTIQGLSTIFNEEYWNYGKLISAVLRHGMPVNYVVKVVSSMDFKNDGINSWKNGVIRALKTFTKDEDLHEPCPKCGGRLRRESGCIQCIDCGWSKCGAN